MNYLSQGIGSLLTCIGIAILIAVAAPVTVAGAIIVFLFVAVVFVVFLLYLWIERSLEGVSDWIRDYQLKRQAEAYSRAVERQNHRYQTALRMKREMREARAKAGIDSAGSPVAASGDEKDSGAQGQRSPG